MMRRAQTVLDLSQIFNHSFSQITSSCFSIKTCVALTIRGRRFVFMQNQEEAAFGQLAGPAVGPAADFWASLAMPGKCGLKN